MKKYIVNIFLLCFVMILTSCVAKNEVNYQLEVLETESKGLSTETITDLEVNSRVEMGDAAFNQLIDQMVLPEASYNTDLTFDDLIERSSSISKGVIIDEQLIGSSLVYKVRIEEDFKGFTEEKEINLYDNRANSYKVGGSYVLFLEYVNSPLQPHKIYHNIYAANLLVNSDGTVEASRSEMNYIEIKDIFKNIKDIKNIVNSKNIDISNNIDFPDLSQMTLEEVVLNSESICVIRATALYEEMTYYNVYECIIIEGLKNVEEKQALIALPKEIELEVNYIALLQPIEGGNYIASTAENSIYKIDSKEYDSILNIVQKSK